MTKFYDVTDTSITLAYRVVKRSQRKEATDILSEFSPAHYSERSEILIERQDDSVFDMSQLSQVH